MYRRRLLYRRLGLGFPLRFSSGGGGVISGEDRRRIVTVGSAASFQRQPGLLFLGLGVVVFSGDGDDICASGGTRYVFSGCDGEAAPWQLEINFSRISVCLGVRRLFDTGESVESVGVRLRRLLYRCLCRLLLRRLREAVVSATRFCFLLVCVGGGRLAVVEDIVVLGDGVLCEGFYTNDAFFDDVSCVGIRVLCGLPCTSCAHDVSGIAILVTNDMAAGGKKTVLYQLDGKSGWFSSSTASGGLFPLLGDSSSGASGLLVIEASDPLLSGDVLAVGHLAWLVRSAIIWHVGVPNVLLMVPLKSSDVLRREGGRLHGQQLRPSATGTTGRNLQGLSCILFYFQGSLCKLWDVNYQKFL
jgi:hypothetical protein